MFAHGSREPGWAEPFEQLAARVRVAAPQAQVRLAFLELMQPDLAGAAVANLTRGVARDRRRAALEWGSLGP